VATGYRNWQVYIGGSEGGSELLKNKSTKQPREKKKKKKKTGGRNRGKPKNT